MSSASTRTPSSPRVPPAPDGSAEARLEHSPTKTRFRRAASWQRRPAAAPHAADRSYPSASVRSGKSGRRPLLRRSPGRAPARGNGLWPPAAVADRNYSCAASTLCPGYSLPADVRSTYSFWGSGFGLPGGGAPRQGRGLQQPLTRNLRGQPRLRGRAGHGAAPSTVFHARRQPATDSGRYSRRRKIHS